ncbi:MAG: hypothetical protein ACYS1C_01850, partial [Planctomycetota bacterium]
AGGDAGQRVRALDSYLSALGLSSPQEDPANWANLLFNVGEGYMLVDRPGVAYDYYRRAVEAGFAFSGAHGEAALIQVSRSATAAGQYGFATRMLQKALALQDESAPEGEGEVAALRRRAEVLDRLALAYHLDGDYVRAVEHYRRYVEVVGRLIREHVDGAPGYRRNLLRGHRNLAVNLYMAVERSGTSPRTLAEAHSLLEQAVRRLDEVGIVAAQRQGRAPGLVTIDVEVALGRRKAAAEFDVAAERRLLHTYMARLNAAGGNYESAVSHLEQKLSLYAEVKDDARQSDVLTERAVVWTQIGAYEAARGDLAAGADAYRRAFELEGRVGNLEGEAAAAVSLGRVVLRMTGQGAAPEAANLIAESLQAQRVTLAQIKQQDAEHLLPLEAALEANTSALMGAGGMQQGGAE